MVHGLRTYLSGSDQRLSQRVVRLDDLRYGEERGGQPLDLEHRSGVERVQVGLGALHLEHEDQRGLGGVGPDAGCSERRSGGPKDSVLQESGELLAIGGRGGLSCPDTEPCNSPPFLGLHGRYGDVRTGAFLIRGRIQCPVRPVDLLAGDPQRERRVGTKLDPRTWIDAGGEREPSGNGKEERLPRRDFPDVFSSSNLRQRSPASPLARTVPDAEGPVRHDASTVVQVSAHSGQLGGRQARRFDENHEVVGRGGPQLLRRGRRSKIPTHILDYLAPSTQLTGMERRIVEEVVICRRIEDHRAEAHIRSGRLGWRQRLRHRGCGLSQPWRELSDVDVLPQGDSCDDDAAADEAEHREPT